MKDINYKCIQSNTTIYLIYYINRYFFGLKDHRQTILQK